jgi:CRP/FNR family transcriptional regulator, cyclic AMP receptor protein
VEREEFLGRLPEADASALMQLGTRQVWPVGAAVFTEGDRSDRVVVVLAGRVKISSYTSGGSEVVLAFRGRGALLGEISAIDQRPRSATVTAVEKVEGLVVGAREFWDYLAEHPAASLLLLRTLASRLRDADRKRIEFGTHDAVGRVARRLVELADRFGEPTPRGIRIGLRFTQEELAGWTGSSREAVVKALRRLRARGCVHTSRMSIVVTDMELLRRYCR